MNARSLGPIRTVAILRGYPEARAVELAQRCWAVGIDLVEVPVQDDEAWRALGSVLEQADGRPVGAGTVIDVARARRAVDLGVEVLIAPGLDEDVIDVARAADVVVLPGVMTPSEVQRGLRAGVDTCKLFPMEPLGSGYLRALRPVFPEVGFVVTGGVGPANAEELVAAGASALAFGGSIEAVLEDPHVLALARSIEQPWLPRAPR